MPTQPEDPIKSSTEQPGKLKSENTEFTSVQYMRKVTAYFRKQAQRL